MNTSLFKIFPLKLKSEDKINYSIQHSLIRITPTIKIFFCSNIPKSIKFKSFAGYKVTLSFIYFFQCTKHYLFKKSISTEQKNNLIDYFNIIVTQLLTLKTNKSIRDFFYELLYFLINWNLTKINLQFYFNNFTVVVKIYKKIILIL